MFQTALSGPLDGLEGGAGDGDLLPAGGGQNQGGTGGDPGSGFFQTALPGPVGGLKRGAGDGPGLHHPYYYDLGASDVPILVVCGVCKLEFKSSHFLMKHKSQEGHFSRKK